MTSTRPTAPAALDQAVGELAERAQAWAGLPVPARIDLVRRCLEAQRSVAEPMVRAACRAKGLDFDTPASVEEWLSGPVAIVRNLRLLAEALAGIQSSGAPALAPDAVRRLPGGQLAVRVFPLTRLDRLVYPIASVDVWMQPGVDEANLRDTMATSYRRGAGPPGKVCLVLAAGNVASIGPMDLLYKLFVENQVAICKMHPVNDYLGPFIEEALRPLLDGGFLRIVYGGAAEGQHLVHHPLVDEIHMTGSAAVHDQIVWGDTPGERARRRADRTPRVAKRITSELGCVTPVIVVPGAWSPGEVAYQAENVATMMAVNASCNCNAAKLVVTWRDWPLRRTFLERVEQVLATLPVRRAYYPGSAARYEHFVAAHPQARRFGAPEAGPIPWTTIFDVDPMQADAPVFCQEAWSPILAETALPAADEAHFLSEATRFCNERVAGTLSVVILLDPRAGARLGAPVGRAVAQLRYGTVAINQWSAANYVLAVAPWGAYPGHTLDAVGSGIGVVHNTLMFERPEKSVLWGPFTAWPKPAWFSTHRRAHIVGRRMVPFEASPAWARLPALALPAARG
jgi:acyl-CoA reductase-like NAD-dependent aldehyde dehydrogenase